MQRKYFPFANHNKQPSLRGNSNEEQNKIIVKPNWSSKIVCLEQTTLTKINWRRKERFGFECGISLGKGDA